MAQETYLQQAERVLHTHADTFTYPEPNRLDVVLPADALVAAVSGLIDARWGYLGSITGLDLPGKPDADDKADGEDPGHFECLYIFFNGAAALVLRVPLPYADPVVTSICPLIPAATLYERELMEMFGIEVSGTPVRDKLVLPDDWQPGVYPLRKSFKGFGEGNQGRRRQVDGTEGS